MKTKLFFSAILSFLYVSIYAQNKTIVNATNPEVSDNLDLRAIASIFGESKDLEDFEFRINDPNAQISNLDLNNDNQVDYLRVIESVEGNIHLIVIQAVLGHDQFQDIATVEVEKGNENRMQVQVVGDSYLFGRNYIYEPVYISVPIIYNYFWISNYHPYYSLWHWGYYPAYYYSWSPFPIFKYRRNIRNHINFNFHYNYVNNRRCQSAYNNYYSRRGNYYERENPNRSFESRNSGYGNRYELDQVRPQRDVFNGNNPRNSESTPRNDGTRNLGSTTREPFNNTPKSSDPRGTNEYIPRNNINETPKNIENNSPRSSESRNQTPRKNNGVGNRSSGGGRR